MYARYSRLIPHQWKGCYGPVCTDEVMAVVGDRLVELQVDEGLPVYVTPLRPIERVIAQLRERETATLPSPLPLTWNWLQVLQIALTS